MATASAGTASAGTASAGIASAGIASAGTGATGGRGLVLVFDLDQTLIDTHVIPDVTMRKSILIWNINNTLNNKLLSIIERAEKLSREKPGSIDAFLLLTNNGGADYVSLVCSIIAERFPSKASNFKRILSENTRVGRRIKAYERLFFDYIMMRGNRHRGGMSKSLMDVRIMLSKLGINDSDLARRTFFFDDMNHPDMRADLRPYDNHYIQIKSNYRPDYGFKSGSSDISDYGSIEAALTRAENDMEAVPRINAPAAAYYPSGPGAYFTAPAPALKSAAPGATMPKLATPPNVSSTTTVTSGTSLASLAGLGITPKATARPSLMAAFAPKSSTPGGKRKTKRRNKNRLTRRR